MATTIDVHEASAHLSRILEDVGGGAEVIIAREGKPMARLLPMHAPSSARVLGLLEGQIHVPDDFAAPQPDDVPDAFEGR